MNGKEMLEFRRRVERSLAQHRLLEPGDRVLVALSGGPDSVALLRVLLELSRTWNFDLHAAHANHQLRGRESDEDENFVEALCEALEVPLTVRSLDAFSVKGNLEDNARKMRYRFLSEKAVELNAAIATGHTRDDQAETFLMKLVRGAGPQGLSAIHPLRIDSLQDEEEHSRELTSGENEVDAAKPETVKVVRPLLELSRKALLRYLENCGQTYRSDRTNEDLSFDRNWIRYSLMPLLKERLNPRTVETIARSAGLFAELYEYLEEQANRYEDEILLSDGVISIPAIQELPLPLRRVLVRRALRRANPGSEISFSHTEDLLNLLNATSGKSISLPGGIRAIREFDRIKLATDLDSPGLFSYSLRVPGQIQVPEVGKAVTVEASPSRKRLSGSSSRGDKSGGVVHLPEGCQVIVRNRRPGDRVRFSPESSPRKLKQHLLEKRMPVSERDRLLLLEWQGQIVWIEGFSTEVPVSRAFQQERQARSLVEMLVSCETFLP